MSVLIAVIAIMIVCTVWAYWEGGGALPLPFRDRTCQGKQWRQSFPDASKHEIRDFLSLFFFAFAFRETDRLKLAPGDTVMAVYRALYPSRWTPDMLEVETLAQDLHQRYGVDLAAAWIEPDLSLGELFAYIQEHKKISQEQIHG